MNELAPKVNSLILALYQIRSIPAQRGLLLLYLSLILIALIPITVITYMPGVDLPEHVLIAVIHAIGPSTYLSADWIPSPYMLFYGIIYPLIHLFGYLIATKLVVMLYIILLPIAIFIFFLEFNTEHWYVSFLTFGFIYNYHFEYGFIPYYFGIPLVFIGLVVAKRAFISKSFTPNIFLATLFSILVYFSHIDNLIAFTVGILCLGTMEIWQSHNEKGCFKTTTFYISKIIIILSPIILISLSYLIYLITNYRSNHSILLMKYSSLLGQSIGALRFLFSLNDTIDFLSIGIVFFIAGWIFIYEHARINLNFPLIFGILMTLCAFIIPRDLFLGSWDHSSRFMIFGAVGILTSIRPQYTYMRWIIGIVAATFFIINVAVRTDFYLKNDSMASQFIDTVNKNIPPDQKVYTVYSAFPEARIPWLQHLISYYHINKGGYSQSLFTGQSHANGLKSSIKLPYMTEIWNESALSLTNFRENISQYDYLVISTFDSPLPIYFSNDFYKNIIYQDKICTIIKLK